MLKPLFRIACLLVLCLQPPAARAQGYANYRIYPSAVTQTEPVTAVSPVNPLFMFTSAVTINTLTGFRSEGVYVTTDGGITWRGSDTCKGASLVNHGGDPGVAITAGGDLVLTHIGSVFQGVYAHYSTDRGITWSNAYTISGGLPEDKGTTVIDDNPGSPFYNRLYSVWVNYINPFPVQVAYSTDGGKTFSTPQTINGTPPARCSGGAVTIGKNGHVYICWAGVEAASPFREDFAGFARSTDGGVTWQVTQSAFDMSGIKGVLAAKGNIKVNGIPQIAIDNSNGPRAGWLYMVSAEQGLLPAGADPDIVLRRSTDGGNTWSAGTRVNGDAINSGNIQYFPAIDIDAWGGINIIFYDDRTTTRDSAEVMLARSIDGGETFIEKAVSSHRFKPKPVVGGSSNYQGDHIDAVSVGGVLHAFWMDDYSGIYQVWTARIPLSGISTAKEAVREKSPETARIFPNPARGQITITGLYQADGFISIRNVLGRECMRLRLNGTGTVTADITFLSPGVYYAAVSGGAKPVPFIVVR